MHNLGDSSSFGPVLAVRLLGGVIVSFVVSFVLSVAVGVLFLVVLSLMREIVLLRGEVAGLTQVITIPPTPSIIGQRLPTEILSTITAGLAGDPEEESSDHAVLFLSPGCGGCDNVVRELESALADALIVHSRITAVVPASPHAQEVAAPLRSHGVTVISDRGVNLFEACDVRGTPMILAVATSSGQAVDYTYEGGVAWILESIRPALLNQEL